MNHYKALVIGSGQGGTPLAKKLAGKGWKTVLIEKNKVGGTCVNVGCTPTKTMIASARVAYMVANAAKYGVLATANGTDIATVLSRKNEVVKKFSSGTLNGLEETDNVTLMYGTASFTGDKQVKVMLNDGGEEELSADFICMDTGTRPVIPPIQGLQEAGYFTSATLMEYEGIPAHLLIIGGGYIGLEFGQMYRRFGSSITVLEHGSRFLPKEDEDIAATVEQFLKEEGVDIYTYAEVVSIQGKAPNITATVKINGEKKDISCSHLLVAAGRTPNTEELHLTAAGIKTDENGFIQVNDKLETSAANIYAIGDVNGGPQFTHISYNDYLILYHNIAEGKNESIHNRLVPYTMFTDPQLGRVGITEKEAKEKGMNVKTAMLPMRSVARAIETGETRGMIKVVTDVEKDIILGVAVVGQEGGEMMSLLQMAMMGGITAEQLRNTIFVHPLYAEALNNLFMQ